MDLDRVRAKRTVVRIIFTKLTTKINNNIETPVGETFSKNEKLDNLLELRSQLIEKINILKDLDLEIESIIDIGDMEKEVMDSEKYRENGNVIRSKLDRCISALEKPLDRIDNMGQDSRVTESRSVSRFESTVKLPRININYFNGDCSEWLDFYNSFEIAIHKNESLSKIEKFTYLKSYLRGTALTAISGFALTSENYDSSIQLLKERFGRPELIISSHMNKLLKLESVKSVNNIHDLRKLYDSIEVQVRSLQSLGVKTESYATLLYPIIFQKIPLEINLQYNRQREAGMMLDIRDLIDFLRKEIECRETATQLGNQSISTETHQRPINRNFKQTLHSYPKRHPTNSYAMIAQSEKEINCVFGCTDKAKVHSSEECSLSVDEKKQAIWMSGKCFICLGVNHITRNCRKKHVRCKCRAGLPHHKLLCKSQNSLLPPRDLNGNVRDREHSSTQSSPSPSEGQTQSDEAGVSALSYSDYKQRDSVFLQTFVANINNQRVRGILDSGSSRSFIKRDIARQLNLKPSTREDLIVYAFGANGKKESFDMVDINLESRWNPNLSINVKAAVTENITQGKIGVPNQLVKKIALEKGLILADDGSSPNIDLLVGSDFICEILGERNLKISKRLMATNSIFGDILQGKIDDNGEVNEVQVNYLSVISGKMDYEKINEFWELENLGICSKENSKSEEQILEKFEENTSYTNGRYETELLWKEDKTQLNNNFEVAKKRIINLNDKFKRDIKLYSSYKEIIQQQLDDGIIELTDCEPKKECSGYFMPHHAVVREQKETTKVRICFDASSKSKGQLSLNDLLYRGPNLNPELLRVILRFRIEKFAMCADIQRAFLEIGIKEDDRKYLQFLWGHDKGTCLDLEGQPIRVLRMTRVPFGVNCSPFLLAATIRTHLKQYEHLEVTEALRDLYVDDFVCSVESLPKAKKYFEDSTRVLKEAGMNLRKWVTSSPELEQWWKENRVDFRESVANPEVDLKVLGLVWNKDMDYLKVDVSQLSRSKNVVLTKRTVLSLCGMVFDPLGMLSPFVVRLKILLQTTWERDLQWDDPLPPDIYGAFQLWVEEVSSVPQISLARTYFPNTSAQGAEIHIFADASPKAYGCVAYFRKMIDRKMRSSFIIAKCRLAPLKKLTLARLELMGALVSARLAEYLERSFPWITPDNIFFWSDSQITLHWIKGDPLRWKEFVRNRVREIQEKTKRDHWHFCSGKTNPADKLTRGLSIHTLIQDDTWWNGPDWLIESDLCLGSKIATGEINETDVANELVKNSVPEDNLVLTLISTDSVEFVDNIIGITNDYAKLIRIMTYVFRFTGNCKNSHSKTVGPFSLKELRSAENFLIRSVQRGEFKEEILMLRKGKHVASNSKLASLNVFIDDNDVLRVGGRLKNSNISDCAKYPIVLPSNHVITDKIISDYHERYLHLGAQSLLYQVRQRFWPLNGKNNCKRAVFKCVTCFKIKPVSQSQIMGNLPKDRVTPNYPFNIIGIDFAGPFLIKYKNQRKGILNKVYVVVYICLCTKAIHLDFVTDQTSESFIASLKRFFGRRGKCAKILTDNSKTFVGAEREIKYLYKLVNSPDRRLSEYFGMESIEWKFIPPKSPNFGGIWEAGVKSFKFHLKRVIGNQKLTLEEFCTILAEIESVLNSRPLTPLSSDFEDFEILSPGHFLIGRPITGLVEPLLCEIKDTSLSKWQKITKFSQKIWKSWKKDYLNTLQQRYKWKFKSNNVKVGNLVLIKDDNLTGTQWLLGRIVEIFHGDDNQVRVVNIKLPNGNIMKRNVRDIAILPMEN